MLLMLTVSIISLGIESPSIALSALLGLTPTKTPFANHNNILTPKGGLDSKFPRGLKECNTFADHAIIM